MFRWFASLPVSSTILATALFLTGTPAANCHNGGGHSGGHGGGHGGAAHHGFYGPYHSYYGHGFYPHYGYGFYRPYYGNGFGGLGLAGLGLGTGLGLGLGAGGYGLGGYGLGGGYGPYLPYGGGYGGPSVVVVNPPATPPPAAGAPPAQTQPPPDNAAHLQLVVPANAEVLFGGEKTTQAGPTREFVSPPLTSGKVFNYTITVRYTDAAGKPVNDKRVISVRANDWFRIDFTRPAPPETTPPPRPE
ncbi:MAG TPA: TIGR03000 domain-containing protein [Gemmataceae bacterium]|jgi:uncharacterized protein (TIGR03000 family)